MLPRQGNNLMNRKSIKNWLLGIGFSVMSLSSWGACEKVVISGEVDWPPYSYVEAGTLKGASIDLAKKLFSELQIPVEVKPVTNAEDLQHQLRHGHIDLLVATYDIPLYEKILHLVLPAYYKEEVKLLVPKGNEFSFDSWYDLMGKTGITGHDTQIGTEFAEFARQYLFLQHQGGLKSLLRGLRGKEQDYLVGSAQYLQYGVSKYPTETPELEFLMNPVGSASIFLGFSRQSACSAYAPFIKAKIEAFNATQEFPELLKMHQP